MRLLLMKVSKGESVPKAGDKLTSKSQGLRSESIRMSNP